MTRRVTGDDGTPTSPRDPHARGREPAEVSPPSPACDRDLKIHNGERQATQSMTRGEPAAEARMTELAGLLAVAALRLCRRVALGPNCRPNAPTAAPSGEKPPETAPRPLDVPADRSVHGDRVVDAPERHQPGGSS